jgi:hypothetical protein
MPVAADPYIDCRQGNLRHAWDYMAVPLDVKPAARGWYREWDRCIRCTTIRKLEISLSTGEVMTRDYEYPPDWIHYSGDDRPTADEFRLLRVKRLNKEERAARRNGRGTAA